MHVAPSGIIIGAAKAGTTTLADILASHPDIGVSNPKEPDYFGGQFHLGEDWYAQCFAHAEGKRILIDASTSYSASLWDAPCSVVAARIAAASPQAKLIYIVRDPVVRAWSSYWHSIRAGETHAPFEQALKHNRAVHITAGLYHARIGEYLQHFTRDSLLLLDFRDLIRNPAAVAAQVATFLGADAQLLPPPAARDSHRNASFQWNGMGSTLKSMIGIGGMRLLAKSARAVFPSRLYVALKDMLSNPTPKLSLSVAQSLTPYFADDAAKLYRDFGIDVRTGPWWAQTRDDQHSQSAANMAHS